MREDETAGFSQEQIDLLSRATMQVTSDQIWNWRPLDKITSIFIHHTATRNNLTAEEIELSMRRTYIDNRWWKVIPTHYIIDKDWGIKKVNDLWIIVWATLNWEANYNGVHIEMVGNFDEHKPTEAQYKMLNQLIVRIQEKAVNAKDIKWHKDVQAKTCPWKNFDFWRVVKHSHDTHITKNTGKYMLTSYYSPQANQSRYFYSHKLGRRRNLVEEITMNCWYNNDISLEENVESCKYPANWWELLPDHAWTVWACSADIPLGTKLHIEWMWEFTCVDRGWAIGKYRIDVWSWYWEEGIDNIEKEKLGVPKYANVKKI